MNSKLLYTMREINKILMNPTAPQELLDKIAEASANYYETSIAIFGKDGTVMASETFIDNNFDIITYPFIKNESIDPLFNEQLNVILELKSNMSLDNLHLGKHSFPGIEKITGTIIPINTDKKRVATVLIYRFNHVCSVDCLLFAEYLTAILSLIIGAYLSKISAEDARKVSAVKSGLATLSYSEIEAVTHIFDELDGNEGLLVASKIADRVGITRSVIVNALRKLESAGIIESRSLGMKGTFIRITNCYLLDELKKMS